MLGPEDDALIGARRRAGQAERLLPPEVGALLAWAAATVGAKHVVEVGSAGGVSGLWLLRGMSDRAILTSIEPDPEMQGWAGRAYAEAGHSDQVRSILGLPLKVLPRLSDGGYDLVLIQTSYVEYPSYVEHVLRLLRPGGLLVALGTLGLGRVAEGSARDDVTDALREFNRTIADAKRLLPTLLPIDAGVTLATRTP